MPLIDLGGLSLWHDVVASPQAHAVPALLVQGLGMQAGDWPAAFVDALAAERPVIVFDNRDAGLSQLLGSSSETLTEADFPSFEALSGPIAYDLFDMAEDALRLLDALGLARVHAVGFSMGGMIAQILAARHPARIASITGLMTSAGQAWLQSAPAADRMMRRSIMAEQDRDRLLAAMLAAEEVYAGPSVLPDIAIRRQAMTDSLARGHHPAGIWRQARAMRAAEDRRELLRRISAPTLMLHGAEDPVIALAQAQAITDYVPAAHFTLLPRTGHILTDANAGAIAPLIRAFWRNSGH